MSNVSLINGHIDEPKQTNYDRIRNMSVEEMANLICHNYRCRKCAYTKCCNGECEIGIKEWLESEVDTE